MLGQFLPRRNSANWTESVGQKAVRREAWDKNPCEEKEVALPGSLPDTWTVFASHSVAVSHPHCFFFSPYLPSQLCDDPSHAPDAIQVLPALDRVLQREEVRLMPSTSTLSYVECLECREPRQPDQKMASLTIIFSHTCFLSARECHWGLPLLSSLLFRP